MACTRHPLAATHRYYCAACLLEEALTPADRVGGASMEAIEMFAGSDPERAVVPPNVVAMMIEYDQRVKHFDVLN